MNTLNMKNRYFMMRHGESVANRKGLIACRPSSALNSYGLTARGAEQVMAAAVNTRLDEHTVIVSSDYLRARESAEIVHGILCSDYPLQLEPELRERDFGELELSEDSNYEHVWQQDMSDPSKRVYNAELVGDVLQRSLKVLQQLDDLYQNQNILLVGHGDVLQILLSYSQNIDTRFHRTITPLKNAEIRSLSAQESFRRSA